MRMLDEDRDSSLNRVTLYLTRSEASELRDSLDALMKDRRERHEHVPSEDYNKELTVCIYDAGDLKSFNERSKRLIILDS